jgi:glutamyl-tRNA(Gln) amidotransferase subunit E
VKKAVNATDDDTLVLVWGNHQDADTGAKEIIIRAREATIGIPSETRQALRDGTNGFERILPGADRMYPDTDLPPKQIADARRERIKATLPLDFWMRESKYRTLGVPEDVVLPLSTSRFAALFSTIVNEWRISPTLASVALVQFIKRMKRSGLDVGLLSLEVMKSIFEAYKNGKISKDAIYHTMKKVVRQGEFSVETLPESCSREELAVVVRSCIARLSNVKVWHPEKRHEILMGMAMENLKGRIEAGAVADYISQELR